MDHQRFDRDRDTNIGSDFLRPVQPIKDASRRRLPAALPIAIAGLLVVTTVAFGATLYGTLSSIANPNATPVVLDDEPTPVVLDDDPGDDPGGGPGGAPTEAPTPTAEPTIAAMTLEASLSGTRVALAWTYFDGDNFAYYKVVRSIDAIVAWPAGANDTVVASINDQNKLTFEDAAPLGHTFTYRVFAVTSATEGIPVLGQSNIVAIATPQPTPTPTPPPTPTPTSAPTPTPDPTPTPTPNCGMSLAAVVVSNEALPNVVAPSTAPASSVKLTWTKYPCDHFEWYVVGKSLSSDIDFPLPHAGTNGIEVSQDVNYLTWTDHGLASGTYYYRVMAWTSKVFCNGGTVLAKTNIVTVVIP